MCFLTVPLVSLQSVTVTFPGHTHLLFKTSRRTEVVHCSKCAQMPFIIKSTLNSDVVAMRGSRRFVRGGSTLTTFF